jgi:3-hydroxybutyryl-CoA dehydrogenase
MGNGIAHTFAQYGYSVTLIDISDEFLKKGLATIEKNMNRQVEKGTLTAEAKQESLSRIKTSTLLKEGIKDADLVVEAATENIELKLIFFVRHLHTPNRMPFLHPIHRPFRSPASQA